MTEREWKIIGVLTGKKKKLTEKELEEQRRKYNEKVKRTYRLKRRGEK